MADDIPPLIAGERYKVISEFIPTQSDELYLQVGDVILVEEAFNDGWALAQNEKTKETGLIPVNFCDPTPYNQSSVTSTAPAATAAAGSGASVTRQATALKRVDSLLYKKPPTKVLTDRQQEVQKKMEAINTGREGRAKVASNIGSLKVLFAGDSGIGKTSLIRSFFSSPEIVDHDPIPASDGVPVIKELRASSIPASELHTGEEPFNLTFVDTPGFGTFMDAMMIVKPIIEYHIAQFQKTDGVFARGVVIPNLVKFLNSGTGCHTHVDACVYCILHRLKPVDIEFMRQLSSQVSIVPVIVKADTLKPTEVFQLKAAILQDLNKAGIPIYGFGLSNEECLELANGEVSGAVPFVVSSPSAAPKGASNGSLNEFEVLKKSLFYHHVDDLRQLSAERFNSWRARAR